MRATEMSRWEYHCARNVVHNESSNTGLSLAGIQFPGPVGEGHHPVAFSRLVGMLTPGGRR